MAEDWIKVRSNLHQDPRVRGMARALGVTRQHIVGCLVIIWGLADQYAVSVFCPREDGTDVPDEFGCMPQYFSEDIDEAAGQPGLAAQMIACDWLRAGAEGVHFPEWDKHHSRSAKARGCDQKRKRDQRRLETLLSGQKRTESVTEKQNEPGLEKRRYNTDTPQPPLGAISADETPRNETLAEIRAIDKPGPRNTIADHPELLPTVRRIITHYKTAVASSNPTRKSAESRLVCLLTSGYSEEQLKNAADGFAAHCRSSGLEAKSRQAAHTFYGDNGSFEQFLDFKPPQPFTPSAQPKRELPSAEELEKVRKMIQEDRSGKDSRS